MNSFLTLQREIQRYGNFLPLHSMYCAENTIKKQKSSIKSIGSQLKKFTAQGLPPFPMSKPERYAPFFRLSWFPVARGLQLGLWQWGQRGPPGG